MIDLYMFSIEIFIFLFLAYCDHQNENNLYWTNTEVDSLDAHIIRMDDSILQVMNKEYFYKIRLFKKVLY